MAYPIKIKSRSNFLNEIYFHRNDENIQMIKSGGIVTVEINFGFSAEKNINFSPIAWSKMWALVHEFDTEVGWHGIARKENGEYFIDDIIVYPQTVTGVTVETDEREYAEFLNSLDDYHFNNNRFHGHSHVQMSVCPSSVDKRFYKEGIIDQMEDDMFYIFMIVNKKHDINVWIHDREDNAVYEMSDINVIPPYSHDFMVNAHQQVKQRTEKFTYGVEDHYDEERIQRYGI